MQQNLPGHVDTVATPISAFVPVSQMNSSRAESEAIGLSSQSWRW